MTRVFHYQIDPAWNNRKIVDFLKSRGYSHACLVHLKKTEQGIRKNEAPVYVTERLAAGDILETCFAEEESSENIVCTPMELHIVYEDEDILLLNKPAGVAIHPSPGNYDNSLANGVMNYYREQGENFVFRCMNRLDRDTSGLVLIAKNMLSAAVLGMRMLNREIHRTYLAVVCGELLPDGCVELPIARVPGSAIERCVSEEHGRRAVTHYERLAYREGYSLAKVWLETGRTHQIRVHMKAIGHPLPGDFLYCPDFERIGRQPLHSWRLSFAHPCTGEWMAFEQEPPEDMKKFFC